MITILAAPRHQVTVKTYAMIRKADTLGVFQIESRVQMAMLPRGRLDRGGMPVNFDRRHVDGDEVSQCG